MFSQKLVKQILLFTLVTTLLLTGVNVKVAQAEETPKYVFFFIGDGMGPSQRQAAEYYLKNATGDKTKKLTMNKFPVAGLNTTQAADSLVTDSAAAGTALATGHKTNSQVIAQKPDGTKLKTLVEAAEEQGMATGIISTSRITHATPATFASHVKSRYLPDKIANQYLESGVEFFAGGGYRHFIPGSGLEYKGQELKSKRKDERNLIEEFEAKEYTTFLSKQDTESFRNYTPQEKEKVFAAFTYSHTPYELDRQRTDATPSIAEMTAKGINTLANYNNGFLMMVEGARIDHACHANDPAGAIHDTLAFDKAVKQAYDFYKQHPNETLIIVAADHETGGFGLGFAKQYFLKMDQLQKAKVTTASALSGKYKEFNQDRDKYFTYIANKLGLENLTAKEKKTITKAMDIVDQGEDYDASTYGPSYYDAVAIATTHVLSKRAGLEWTTYAHSATPVPLTAIGVGAEKLGGYKDNTEVGQTIAHIMNFQLTTIY